MTKCRIKQYDKFGKIILVAYFEDIKEAIDFAKDMEEDSDGAILLEWGKALEED